MTPPRPVTGDFIQDNMIHLVEKAIEDDIRAWIEDKHAAEEVQMEFGEE